MKKLPELTEVEALKIMDKVTRITHSRRDGFSQLQIVESWNKVIVDFWEKKGYFFEKTDRRTKKEGKIP